MLEEGPAFSAKRQSMAGLFGSVPQSQRHRFGAQYRLFVGSRP
jgi:hypothetical protein